MSEAQQLAKSFMAMYGGEAIAKALEHAERQKRNGDPVQEQLWQQVVAIIKAAPSGKA